jgi:hypothetical protein
VALKPDNPLVGGTVLRRAAIQSPNYVPGVSGWAIFQDGTVEFNNGIFRGSLSAGIISGTPIGSSSITGSDFSQGTIETTVIRLDASGGQVLAYGSVLVTQTFNVSGNITFPAGVTSARVQLWGGARAGPDSIGTPPQPQPGQGGGEYAEETLAVHAATYAVTAGTAAAPLSSFPGDAKTIFAHGGATPVGLAGGKGGSGSLAAIHFPGGDGGNSTAGGVHGGGGGSSASPSAAGNNGAPGSAGGAGGAAPPGGFAGGNGGTSGNPGAAGTAPGGAPGGAGLGGAGTAGSAGRAIVTYQTSATALIAAIAGIAGTDAAGNAWGPGINGQIKAFQPGVTPTVAETWHTLGTLAGYTVTIGRYRLTPDNELELDIKCAGGGAQAQTVSFSVTLPAAYRPVTQHDTLPMGTTKAIAAGDIWPRILVTTAGVVTVNATPNSATTIACCVRIPLD